MRKIFSLIALLCVAFSTHAVTDAEMEQARTITARLYLRWANDGSGYLDEVSATTMTSLEKTLKPKELENLKSFKAVNVPKDYASWDKERLVEYWSKTFFASPGLLEKGRAAKGQVKAKIQKMTVSAPAAAAAAPAVSAAKPAETPAAEAAPVSGGGIPDLDSMAAAMDMIDSTALAEAEAEESVVTEGEKKSGSTVWIYIVALCLLVGVVIWLVIFASKTMNSNSDDYPEVKGKEKESADDEVEIPAVATTGADDRLREKFADSLARKNEELRSLNRELLDLREECLRLGEENGRLTLENNRLKHDVEKLRIEARAAENERAAAAAIAEEVPAAAPRRRAAATREIYLGRVNSKGLFVRADREFTPGKSVYRLTTKDGFTGSFRVVTDEEMMDTMLDNPLEWLSGGCVAKDIEDTDGMMEIETESAGTAIFEEGCWRVLRKAKISYR